MLLSKPLKKAETLLTLWISLLILAGCAKPNNSGGDPSTTNYAGGDPVLTKAALAVFQNRCASCHSGTQNIGVGGITDIMNVASLIQTKQIVPSSLGGSPVYVSMLMGRMPTSGAVSSAELQTVATWITQGFTSTTTTTGTTPSASAHFSIIEANLLKPQCVSCHGGLGSYTGVMKYVVPGDYINSTLYQVMATGNMPPKGQVATDDLTALVDWIKAGAKND